LIDVRILAVKFDDSRTTGVDWSQLYGLQNFTVNSLAMAQKNIAEYTFDQLSGITDASFAPDTQPKNAKLVQFTGKAQINEVVLQEKHKSMKSSNFWQHKAMLKLSQAQE